MTLQDRIYSIMKSKKMCQAAVARSGGYTPRRFNDMLRGRTRITSNDIPRLCAALGVSPNDLFKDVSARATTDQAS